jgi:RNA polymerase sigma-70 factor (ECF subfamily)
MVRAMSLPDMLRTVLGEDPGAIPETLAVIAAGEAAWPGVKVDPVRLATRVKARRQQAEGAERHDADLYLATALGEGDRAALTVFEQKLVPEIDAALQRMRLPASAIDEVRQAIRVDLLVADEGQARIDGYLGLGPLAAWLRVSATRRALKLLRSTRREETLEDAMLEHWPGAGPDPEKGHLKSTYQAQLKGAITASFAALSVRERNLLRQHVLDDLTIDELALLYRVHRSTCARWLVDARTSLAKGVRNRIRDGAGVRGDELDSLLRFVDSDIELSISRILRESPAA